jgi:Cysteine-rich secretory protein family
MMLLLAGGLALWLLAVLVILSVCRAAARADDNDAGRRIVRASRRGVSVGMAAAVVTLPSLTTDDADARRRVPVCANRDVQFELAPVKARHALLCEVARLRAKRGLGRLHENTLLDRASRRHAADMVDRGYFSHESPGGAGPGDRARRVGYARSRCSWRIGEVLAWGVAGRSTAAATVQAWLDSPEHRRILVARKYDEIGGWMVDGTPERQYPSGVTVAAVFGERHCST